MSARHETPDLCIVGAPFERCSELVALRAPATSEFGEGWPIAPGKVRLAPSGAAELLHFAPGRWLMPDPSKALMQQSERYVVAGAAELIDVEGKWRKIVLSGEAAMRVLAAGAAVESLLAECDCAALTLFDCPVILAGGTSRFELWVPSSYFPSFSSTLESLRDRVRVAKT